MIDRDNICVACWHPIHPDRICGAEDWAPGPNGDEMTGYCICKESVSANQRGEITIPRSYNG